MASREVQAGFFSASAAAAPACPAMPEANRYNSSRPRPTRPPPSWNIHCASGCSVKETRRYSAAMTFLAYRSCLPPQHAHALPCRTWKYSDLSAGTRNVPYHGEKIRAFEILPHCDEVPGPKNVSAMKSHSHCNRHLPSPVEVQRAIQG